MEAQRPRRWRPWIAWGVWCGLAFPHSAIAQVLVDEQANFKAPGSESANQFGGAVGLTDEWAIIGAQGSNGLDTDAGAVYVYRFDGQLWHHFQSIDPVDPARSGQFGRSLAIDGDTLLIGTRQEIVYFFRFDGAAWVLEQRVAPTTDFNFGAECDLQGDVAAVTEPGAHHPTSGDITGSVHVYRFDGAQWTEEAELFASDATMGDTFGSEVALNGNVLATSSFAADNLTGRAYVFEYDGTDWIEAHRIDASDGEEGDQFGVSLALDGDVLAVRSNDSGTDGHGQVYIYRYLGSSWVEETTLIASDSEADDSFGWSLSLRGDRLVVGAPLKNHVENEAGLAYLFRDTDSGWVEERWYVAATPLADTRNGGSCAQHGEKLLLGAAPKATRARTGWSYVYSTADMTLDLQPPIVREGDNFHFEAYCGRPGRLMLLALTAANGIPVFVPVLLGTFDANSHWTLDGTIPTGLSGIEATLVAYGIGLSDEVEVSAPAVLSIR